jgi:hypothetical protein
VRQPYKYIIYFICFFFTFISSWSKSAVNDSGDNTSLTVAERHNGVKTGSRDAADGHNNDNGYFVDVGDCWNNIETGSRDAADGHDNIAFAAGVVERKLSRY